MTDGPRLLLITTGPSAVLDELLAPRHHLCGIVHSRSRRRDPPSRGSRLERLARRLDRFGHAHRSLDALAARCGLPYYAMDRGTDPALVSWVSQRRPDLIVICGMVRLLGREVFSIPPLGALNVHPSLLPRYRGPDPIFWTYHGMDRESGVTVHLVDAGADTGDIVYQESFSVPTGMPRRELLTAGLGRLAPEMVVRAIEALSCGDCPRRTQPRESPTPPARRVKPTEFRELIGWDRWPIERVWHVLRGMAWIHGVDPPPGWRASLGWSVGPYVAGSAPGRPGSVGRDLEGYYLAHPEGKIRVTVPYSGRAVLRALARRIV